MQNSRPRFVLGLLGCGLLAACTGTPVPQTQLTDAKAATSAARAVGARDEPEAALHLKMAEDAIVEAEKWIAEGENDDALPLLQRARADAQLALSLTAMAERQRAATVAIEKLEMLERDLGVKGDKS
jgi:hypothetical protein